MELTSVKELYRSREAYIDKKVTVGGWLRGNRDSKTFGFLVVNDGTFFETLQVVYDADKISNFEESCGGLSENLGFEMSILYELTFCPPILVK